MTAPEYGTAHELGDGIRRILAPNPGPMTQLGTNTWLLGEQEVAIIDPGPEDARHLTAVLGAIKGQTVTHILVTHAHADHSPLARKLAQETQAPIYAFGRAEAGRSDVMDRLAEDAKLEGGEGVDRSFKPDLEVSEGAQLAGDGWMLDVLHTPGHFAGHLAFRYGDTLFSGDHVMDWSTSLVSPPDGDLRAFMKTSARLSALDLQRCLTGHGGEIHEPTSRLEWLISHRQSREAQILECLSGGIDGIADITQSIYRDLAPSLHPAASRNVLAHLIDLVERNVVLAIPEISPSARFQLT